MQEGDPSSRSTGAVGAGEMELEVNEQHRKRSRSPHGTAPVNPRNSGSKIYSFIGRRKRTIGGRLQLADDDLQVFEVFKSSSLQSLYGVQSSKSSVVLKVFKSPVFVWGPVFEV